MCSANPARGISSGVRDALCLQKNPGRDRQRCSRVNLDAPCASDAAEKVWMQILEMLPRLVRSKGGRNAPACPADTRASISFHRRDDCAGARMAAPGSNRISCPCAGRRGNTRWAGELRCLCPCAQMIADPRVGFDALQPVSNHSSPLCGGICCFRGHLVHFPDECIDTSMYPSTGLSLSLRRSNAWRALRGAAGQSLQLMGEPGLLAASCRHERRDKNPGVSSHFMVLQSTKTHLAVLLALAL